MDIINNTTHKLGDDLKASISTNPYECWVVRVVQERPLTVYLAAIADFYHKDAKRIVIDVGSYPVIPTLYFQNSPKREPLRSSPMRRGLLNNTIRSLRKARMRRAI